MKRLKAILLLVILVAAAGCRDKNLSAEGDKHALKKNFQAAREIYEKAADKGDTYACYQIGNLYYRGLGTGRDFKKAAEYFKKAADKGYVKAQNALAWLYAVEGKKLDEAEKLALKAVQAEPLDGAFHDTLGWVYYRKGEYEKAIRQLKRAKVLEPQNALIKYHLARAYLKAGMKNKVDELRESVLRKIKNSGHLSGEILSPRYLGKNQFIISKTEKDGDEMVIIVPELSIDHRKNLIICHNSCIMTRNREKPVLSREHKEKFILSLPEDSVLVIDGKWLQTPLALQVLSVYTQAQAQPRPGPNSGISSAPKP